jgi:hypothetical protein
MADQDEANANILVNELDQSAYQTQSVYKGHLLDQYKLYLELADRNSGRRQAANSFFLTVNTTVLSFIGYLNLKTTASITDGFFWMVAACGMAMCYLWYRMVRSYRDLNSAKFKVIHMIEKELPLSPMDAEWEMLGRGTRSDLYLPFTHIEMAIPWFFIVLHGFVIIRSTPWKIILIKLSQ